MASSIKDLRAAVSEKLPDLSKAQVASVVSAVFDSVAELTNENDSVQVIGFGTFKKFHRAERQGRNPSSGEAATYPAKNVLKFKPSKNVEAAFNA
jgi:nucleoid DNA-binding protein